MEERKLGIVIPAYNEEKRINRTLEEYGSFFSEVEKKHRLKTEVLIVINNTKDKTEEIVRRHQKRFKNIKYLNFKRGGKGFAITEGFKYFIEKNYDLIGFTDADCSTPPKAFYDLVLQIGNYDGAIANRWDRKSIIPVKQSFFRRLISRVFNFIVRSSLFINSQDTQCGAKLFKKNALEKTIKEVEVSEWAFDVNLLYVLKKEGFKIKDIPTYWRDDKGSTLKTGKASLQMFLSVLRLRIVHSPFERLSKPLRPVVRNIYNLTK